MKNVTNTKYILIGILVLAALLRIPFISRGDTITDEVSYAFRAIGMVDFDAAVDQTTPLEWFDPERPWWTRLSFHDHPPLVFLIQNISMKIFGDTNFGFRLPSALFGIAAVYLVFRIGALLYSERVGLAAAFLLAVTANHVYISRIGLQESQAIFLFLLTMFLFLKARGDDRYFIWTGAALGFALLTKYTALILIPIFLAYLLFADRATFKNKKMWLGALVAAAVFSPVIIYNLMLYSRVGHFDFQFSFIFGQNPDVWKIAPGKEIGSLGARIARFVPTLVKTNSWLFLGLFGISLLGFAYSLRKKFAEQAKRHMFLAVSFVFLALLLLVIGPSYRFLTVLTPFFAIAIAAALYDLAHQQKYFLVLIALIGAWEIFYSVNSQIMYYPRGPEVFAYSPGIRSENYNWGYNDLQEYLGNVLEGRMPAAMIDTRYKFLNDLHDEAGERGKKDGLRPFSVAVIYDGNVQNMAQLWVLDRLNMYHGWPVFKTEQYIQFLQANNISDFTSGVFDQHHFIVVSPNANIPRKSPPFLTTTARQMEALLIDRGIKPTSITNRRGEEVFRVYKF